MAARERRRRATERYDFLVIDEVQDVTPVELRLALATLKDKAAFLLCGDSNQIVHPNLFSWARVKSLFHGEDARRGDPSPLERIHVLSANYRNTRAVTALANRLLLLRPVPWAVADAATLAGLRARALGPGPIDKSAQQHLFEFAVTYDAPALLPRLAAAPPAGCAATDHRDNIQVCV